MERKISFNDVTKAIEEAFEQFKSDKEGTVDPRVQGDYKPDTFGISVTLADGRTFDKGDTTAQVPLGSVAKLPLSLVLLSQNLGDELFNKSCCCGCRKDNKPKIDMPFGKHGLRTVSAIIPQGDPDGKFKVITDMVYSLTASERGFSDSLYKYYTDTIKANNIVESLTNAGIRLYDDVAQSLDVYARVLSLKLSVSQMSVMGATVSADGRNPVNGEYAFDGKYAAPAIALMASRGKHFIKRWIVKTGLPAKKSFTGAMLAILPGFGAIAAYSPETDERGVPVKASKAIAYIAEKLGLNVFASDRICVSK